MGHGVIGFDLEGEGEPPEGLSIGMTRSVLDFCKGHSCKVENRFRERSRVKMGFIRKLFGDLGMR